MGRGNIIKNNGNIPLDERPLEVNAAGYTRPAGSTQSFKKFPMIPAGTNPHAARIKPDEIEDMMKVAERDKRESDALRFMARRATSMALSTLAAICEKGKNETARVAAAKEILDRGWGKSHVLAGDDPRPNQQIKVVFGERPKVQVIDGQSANEDPDDETTDADTDTAA